MKIPELLEDLAIISKLGDNPGSDDGLSADDLKAKFDQAALIIKKYINGTLVPGIESLSRGGIVISQTKPNLSGVLWFDTSRGGAASAVSMLSLDEDESGYPVTAAVEGETYGVGNATVNQGASSGGYDFTVL